MLRVLLEKHTLVPEAKLPRSDDKGWNEELLFDGCEKCSSCGVFVVLRMDV